MRDWNYLVRQRLESLRLNGPAEAELAEELAQHLADHYSELCSGGMNEEAAFRQTMAQLNEVHPLKEKRNQMPVDDLWRDLRYAFRTMRKNPMFVLFVVLTLALGIGANTTVFTVINTLVLNPLPAPHASELAAVGEADAQGAPIPISYEDLKDYQAHNQVFASLGGYTASRTMTWQQGGAAERMFGELVTPDYFPTLGLQPFRGRFFRADENRTTGTHPVAVVSYGTWQARLAGTPDIIGKTLRINNVVLTIVGVAPEHFIGVNAIFGPDLWVPAAMAPLLLPNEMQEALTSRAIANFQAVGRLKPGTTLKQAQANLLTISSALSKQYPATNANHPALVRPVREAMFGMAASTATPIFLGSMLLLAVVGAVLLIACSNVANLLLARAAARTQEMAVRLAMGASRGRLIKQMLTESVLMGLLSGALGLFIGYVGLKVLFGRLPNAANFMAPKFDGAVFGFALAISLATGFLFGLLPALKAARANVAESLKEESRTTGRSRRKITVANTLLVGQVAFSFILLVTAALFLRSIGRAYEIDPGVQTAHLAVFMTNPGQAGYGKERTKAFYEDVLGRVSRMPGVDSASWASNLPLWSRAASGLIIEGRQVRSATDTLRTIVNTIGDGYFETAGARLTAGRSFTSMDIGATTPVAIVNEKLAHDYWPEGAIGKRLQLPGESTMRQIVGVARNANYTTLGEAPQPCVYVPLEQHYSDGMVLYVKTKADPTELVLPVEREIRAAGPQILMASSRTGAEILDGGLFQAKMGVALLTVFGLLALVLASVGLYGILAYSVNQRKREFGLRMALGASHGSVLALIVKEGMSLVLAGITIGFAVSLLTGPMLSRMLYGVGSSDPSSVTAAAVVLASVALLACYLPARWATRVDPLTALREG